MWERKLKLVDTNSSVAAVRGKGWVGAKGASYTAADGLTLGGTANDIQDDTQMMYRRTVHLKPT